MPARNRADEILSGFGEEQLLQIGVRVARYLATQDPRVDLYLVPAGEGSVLSGPAMAGEIAAQTDVGRAFINLFVVGATLNERQADQRRDLGLTEALRILDLAAEGNQ